MGANLRPCDPLAASVSSILVGEDQLNRLRAVRLLRNQSSSKDFRRLHAS